MITGFNTDLKHDGILYHVQTEDKGPENPLLLSLVYVGGAILAAKRTNYAKELEEGLTEEELQKKLEKQHRLILAIISRGRINDLVKMREREVQSEREAAGLPPVFSAEKPIEPEVSAPVSEVTPSFELPPRVEVPPLPSITGGAQLLPPQPFEPPAPPPVPVYTPPPPAFSERPAGVTELLSPLLAQQLGPLSELPVSPPPVPEKPAGVTELLSPLLAQQYLSQPPPPPVSLPPATEKPAGVTEMLSPLLAQQYLSQQPPPPPPPSGSQSFTGSLDSLLHQIVSGGQITVENTAPDPNLMHPQPIRQPDSGYLNTGSLPSGPLGKTTGSFREFDLDRIISEYLQTESKEEKPEIRLLGNTNFFAGETVVLQVEVTRGATRTPLASTPVLVKILGTAFKPQTHSMLTGDDGIAMTTITLPNFSAGSAAIVVQTSTDAGEAEIKQLIRRR